MVYSFYLSLSFLLVIILIFLFLLIDLDSMGSYWEKGSPFECGFQSFFSGGFSFSLPFFLISLVFLLFDVEILLVCFYPIFFCSVFSLSYFSFFLLFLIIFSTFFEWAKGVLVWA